MLFPCDILWALQALHFDIGNSGIFILVITLKIHLWLYFVKSAFHIVKKLWFIFDVPTGWFSFTSLCFYLKLRSLMNFFAIFLIDFVRALLYCLNKFTCLSSIIMKCYEFSWIFSFVFRNKSILGSAFCRDRTWNILISYFSLTKLVCFLIQQVFRWIQ